MNDDQPGALLFSKKPTTLRVATDDSAGDTLYVLTWREDGEPRRPNGVVDVVVTVRERGGGNDGRS